MLHRKITTLWQTHKKLTTALVCPTATARRRANAVRRLVPAFVSPQAFRAATLAASGYGGERQSRRECRLGDGGEVSLETSAEQDARVQLESHRPVPVTAIPTRAPARPLALASRMTAGALVGRAATERGLAHCLSSASGDVLLGQPGEHQSSRVRAGR
jgi:hypothetical protein